MDRRRFLLAAASPLAALPRLRAQDETPTFKTEVKVVDVLATVRNKRGEFIRDLDKDDFAVFENGRPQTIRYFSRQTDLPLTLGVLIDTSMSQQKVMDAERVASFDFLDQVIREKQDHVFVMQFDLSVIMRQPLTSSIRKLHDGLLAVDTPSMNDLRNQTGGGTMLYDAVLKASRDVMNAQQGRKAIIILTDGVDTGSEATLPESIEAAVRADTLIYSILFSDEGAYGFFGGPDGAKVLERMSKDTGGGFFAVTKKANLEQVYAGIQDELRSQYNIGYVSDKPVDVSEFRQIRLTVKPKGLIVQARDRYWARH